MSGLLPPVFECLALASDLLVGIAAARGLSGRARADVTWSVLCGIALGALIASGITFLEWAVFERRTALVLGGEIAAGLVAAIALVRMRGTAGSGRDRAPIPRLLAVLCALTALAAVLAMVRHVQELPLGDYDAIAIWNKRARSLFFARERFGEVLSGAFAMPQSCYPLLVPALVDRLWRCGGCDWQLAPVLVGAGAWLAIALGVGTTVARLQSRALGCVAATLLLGTPFLARNAVDQYADVPVAAFYALGCASLLRGHLVLAGALAGAAAWTKNEGLLFVCAFGAALLILHPPRVRTAVRVALGLAGPLALLLVFKLHARVGDEYLDRTLGQTLAMLADPGRLWLVFREYALELWALGSGLFVGTTVLALALAERPWRAGTRTVVTALGIMLCGLFVVLVRTPYDLAYDLATTKNRSMIQLWPCWVLAMFSGVRDPWRTGTPVTSAATA